MVIDIVTQCARFAPQNSSQMYGQADGLDAVVHVFVAVQVWDFITGKLKKDLQFQADEQFMMHDEAVLALSFSKDSELLVSGSQDGKIKACKSHTCTLHVLSNQHRIGVLSVAIVMGSSCDAEGGRKIFTIRLSHAEGHGCQSCWMLQPSQQLYNQRRCCKLSEHELQACA